MLIDIHEVRSDGGDGDSPLCPVGVLLPDDVPLPALASEEDRSSAPSTIPKALWVSGVETFGVPNY